LGPGIFTKFNNFDVIGPNTRWSFQLLADPPPLLVNPLSFLDDSSSSSTPWGDSLQHLAHSSLLIADPPPRFLGDPSQLLANPPPPRADPFQILIDPSTISADLRQYLLFLLARC
jgi:hypothetical protein